MTASQENPPPAEAIPSIPSNTRLHLALGFGVLVSLGWLCALYFLLWQTSPCPAGDNQSLWGRLACRTPNELGDFLAGAFAPLAFFWFVLAVLLQTLELKSQREELHATNLSGAQQAKWAKVNAKIMQEEQGLKVMEALISKVSYRLISTPIFVEFLQLDGDRKSPRRLLNVDDIKGSALLHKSGEGFIS
ncbi:hypothetical protein PH5382_03916 [Phaeobacter sp. CECT 5382]|uniref:hypothetical protein n=1 Tax=Phaeobacter sp. CECT 5382 TaxID=1712645 RepID=UPI0006DA6E4C|nr:hypothetical protein [Phaeobacter sp. CECT 5382]CUH89961.1 hypothetical protein PH5382_03916 [Phaeobacter sp. CECT 5382]